MADPMHNDRPIIQERQTVLGLYVTAKEAYDMWQADPEGVTILDVRTPEEWVFTGHPPMAVNIPIAFLAYVWDDAKKGFPWSLNPDFVALVKERFSPDDTLLVTCRSGGRGAMAVNMLAKAAGFTNALQHPRRDGGRHRRRPRQRLQGHAPAQRLADVGPAVDVQHRPHTDGAARARDRGTALRQRRRLTTHRALRGGGPPLPPSSRRAKGCGRSRQPHRGCQHPAA